MTTRLLFAGAVTLGLASTAGAQQMATDRVEAIMIAGGRDALPIHEEKLTVDIDGEYASATLVQTYLNNTPGRIEGNYRLRPGSGSHVDGFAYWNGEQKIVGEVFEKQTARQVYDSVTTRRRDPGLLEQDGEGAFTFKVFPIEAKEKKRVEMRWTKWLERRTKTVTYHAPVTRALLQASGQEQYNGCSQSTVRPQAASRLRAGARPQCPPQSAAARLLPGGWSVLQHHDVRGDRAVRHHLL